MVSTFELLRNPFGPVEDMLVVPAYTDLPGFKLAMVLYPLQRAITELLVDWRQGNQSALEELTPLIHGELRQIAARVFRGERAGHTLQATALVNEAFINLMGADVGWQDRAHFFALAARTMRRILVNHANARNADKRGAGLANVTLHEELAGNGDADQQIQLLHDCLNALQEFDSRKADILELHYFGGLTFDEMSEVTNLSASTLTRELRMAKAWLARQMSHS